MSIAMPPIPSPVPTRRFTVDEYHRMIETGILGEEDKVELLEGWIVPKMVRGPRHDNTIDRVQEALRKRIPATWRVRIQSAVTTMDSEPEPDVAVVKGPLSRYDERHPKAEDVALVVEVAESSLAHDREIKLRVYARAGIGVYWIVNLLNNVVEVYTEPTGTDSMPAFGVRQVFAAGGQVPLHVGGDELAGIPIAEILG